MRAFCYLAVASLAISAACSSADELVAPVAATSAADDTGTAARLGPPKPVLPHIKYSVYQFAPLSILGVPTPLRQYRGRKLLIVNTASLCRYTPQYAELEQLYQQYGNRVVVLGFPCNDFGGQNPDDDTATSNFCNNNYQITFPLFHRIHVIGASSDPLFRFLRNGVVNGGVTQYPSWNFGKYLVDENGFVKKFYASAVSPLDTSIVNAILR